MKKILLPILALSGLLFASSCQMDEPDAGTLTGEVDFTISAGIPGSITTYADGESETAFSHLGGANNVDATHYDLRYILEVYDGDNLAYREVKYVDEGFADTKASFSARLLAKSYTFVLWADFVETKTDETQYTDLYYNTASLKEISYNTTNAADLTKDEIDAYTAKKVIDLSKSSKSESITLTRPFGKIRLLATDKDIANNDTETPVSVKLDFGSAKFPSSFNALTGDVTGEFAVNAVTTSSVKEDAQSVDGTTKYEGAYLLGYIYAFASKPQAAYPIDVTVYSDADATSQIGYRELTNIPVSANKLTTVVGNFYSNEGNIEVVVEDKFGDGEEEIPLPDAVSASSLDELNRLLADPDIDAIALTSNMEITETINVDRAVLLTGGATITTSGGNPVFTLSAEGAVIDGLNFYQNSNDSQSIIKVTAKNCEIRNCTFEGKYQDGNSEETRAIVPNAGVAVTVEGNTFRNIRQPGYFEATGTVLRNNYVEGTRGFVICSNHEMTIEGNSFLNNAVDIAIIENGSPYSNIYDDVRALSENNNGAFVENQVTKTSAIGNGNSEALSDALKNATTIELLAGEYTLPGTVTLENSMTINGSSSDEVKINIPENSTIKVISGSITKVTLVGKEGTMLSGNLQGDCVFEDVVFEYTGNAGNIFNENSSQATGSTSLQSSHSDANASDGQHEIKFIHCDFRCNGQNPLSLGASSAVVENCSFDNPGSYIARLGEESKNSVLTFRNNTVSTDLGTEKYYTYVQISDEGNSAGNVIYIEGNTVDTLGFRPTVRKKWNNFYFTNAESNVKIYVDGIEGGVWYQSSIYNIENADGLFWFANQLELSSIQFKGTTLKLLADIDLAGKEWTSMDFWYPESGIPAVIDGNGKTISNMTINGAGSLGFIGRHAATSMLEIKNLTFYEPHIRNSSSFVGTVVGYTYGNITMNNVIVTGADIRATAAVVIRMGGVFGFYPPDANSPLLLNNCKVENSTIQGYHNLAGFGSSLGTASKYTDSQSNNNIFYYEASNEESWQDFDASGYAPGTGVKEKCTTTGNQGIKYTRE